jgi:hypothetical protein
MRTQTVSYIIIAAAIGAFLWLAFSFDFYQDDAYITYRYVDNYLNGDGLVFNVGERVEGYTNFGWLLYLLLMGVLGLPVALVSKLTGILLGAATIYVSYLIARQCSGRDDPDDRVSVLPAAILVAGNLSFAYWAQAGLESAAFVLLVALGLYLFLIRHWLLIAVLTFAVLVRPEGALLAGLLVVIETVVYRRRPRFSTVCLLTALALSLPFVGFKLAYYGSILPNPFYAKTGFDLQQVTAGLDYAGRFFSHYPLFAAVMAVTPLFWRRLTRSTQAVWLFGILYILYIIMIGGDVLKVHRFFLPILAPLSVLAAVLIRLPVVRLKAVWRYVTLTLVTGGLLAVSLYIPRDFITEYEYREEALIDKMAFLAHQLKEIDSGDFTVATSTIGALAYNLPGHQVIDILGLTDTTIARHPEPVPEGLETSWRERNFNSPYLLSRAPDYVIFATGYKPSAPAERVLMTYRQFLDCYGGASFYYQPPGAQLENPLVSIFRKKAELVPPFVSSLPIGFVQAYNMGINAGNAGRYQESNRYFKEALRLGGEPPYVYLLMRIAMNGFFLGDAERSEVLRNRIIEIDSSVAEVQADLYIYEYTIGNREKAAIHRSWMKKLSPWLLRRYDSLALVRAEWWQNRPVDSL